MAARQKPARAAAVALRRAPAPGRLDTILRYAPSGRSLLIGFGLLAAGVLLYVGARTTSVFAVRTLEVEGAGPADAARVRRALEPVRGTSLVALDTDAVRARLDVLPEVASVTIDRAYPHTLRLEVVPERPVVVVRRGADSWLVSGRARVIRRVPRGAAARLPRVWVPKQTDVVRGATLDPSAGGAAARALAVLRAARFAAPVRTVDATGGRLTLTLGDRIELRFGALDDLRLKLAVVRRALPFVGPGSYLDVSVPQRPVSGTLKSKVEL